MLERNIDIIFGDFHFQLFRNKDRKLIQMK